jgi:type II secretory pathway pseudopilin PulG
MKKGVTFVELIVVIGVLVIIFAMSVPGFTFFQKGSSLNNDAEKVVNVLRLAQDKTLTSEGSSQYGVFFQAPDQYTLFKGADYVSRDVSYDKVYNLSSGVEIYDGLTEVVFKSITGFIDPPGYISLRLVSEPSNAKTIYIEGSGHSSLSLPSLPSGSKVEDSRHMHFDYTRVIDTVTEDIVLDVGGIVQNISIVDNISSGQFFWEGEIEGQFLKIHTHRLNNPDTQICIHRDRRLNNKTLSVSISGDLSGAIADYSADGSTVLIESIYVSSAEKQ